jgi:hypothetical protein
VNNEINFGKSLMAKSPNVQSSDTAAERDVEMKV